MKDLVYYVHSTISVVLGFMIMVGIEIGEE